MIPHGPWLTIGARRGSVRCCHLELMTATNLLACPKCRQKIRIPAESDTVHVTCPNCHESWDWPPRKTPSDNQKCSSRCNLAGVMAWVERCRANAACRRATPYTRSSALLMAGMVLGIFVGYRLAPHGVLPPPSPLKSIPTTSSLDFVGTNAEDPATWKTPLEEMTHTNTTGVPTQKDRREH